MVPPDLHIHTPFSEHGTGTMEEMVRMAIQKGFSEIGFSDHFPYPAGFVPPAPHCVIPNMVQFETYLAEMHRLQSMYEDRICIRCGIELDYLEAYPDRFEEIQKQYALDYVIGSVHIVRGVAIDYQESMLLEHLEELGGVDGLWEKYWEVLSQMLRKPECHIVGHLDIAKKFSCSHPSRDFREPVDEILRLIKEKNLVLEVNTSGIDKASDREPYPSFFYLKRAKELDVEITLGSDAHHPKEVGRYFEKVLQRIRDLGWEYVVTFERGKKKYLKIF